MSDRISAHDRIDWDSQLAERLLTALDREDVLCECCCPECGQRLIVEPRRRQRMLNVSIIEETGLRCPQCELSASLIYRELNAAEGDRSVMINGRVVREEHAVA